MVNKKIFCLECAILIGIFITLGLVSALGAGTLYSMDNPLKINPGQSVDVPIRLQSSVSDGNVTVIAEIEEGSDIAKIIDSSKEYNVIANQPVGAIVNLRVSVPENARVGTEYNIRIRYRDITPKEEGGMVGLSFSISNSFKVVVVAKPEEIPAVAPTPTPTPKGISTTTIVLLVIGIIVVIAIIVLLIKRKK